MTARYARLMQATVRREWNKARAATISGPLRSDDSLLDAAYLRHELSRAKMALPNGFCGLPPQRTCPHANACLTCPVFVTTPDFLPQHRQQLEQTRRLLAVARQDGHFRMVEMNETVEHNLQRIISALENETDHVDSNEDPDDAAS